MDKLDKYKKKSILSGVLLILCNAFISFVFNSGALITYNIFYVAIDALLFMLPSKVSVLLGSAYFTMQVLLTAAYGMKNAGFLGILLCFLALALVVVHIKFMFRYINALKKIAKENLRKHEEQKNADSPSVIMSSNKNSAMILPGVVSSRLLSRCFLESRRSLVYVGYLPMGGLLD